MRFSLATTMYKLKLQGQEVTNLKKQNVKNEKIYIYLQTIDAWVKVQKSFQLAKCL